MKTVVSMWAAGAALGLGTSLCATLSLAAQPAVRLAPQTQQPGPAATPAQMPSGTGPQARATANPFPAPNPRNFTAASPTKDEVDAFLKAQWGYEPNRVWQVSAIQATAAPQVSKVVVLVADKSQPGKTATTVFFTTPDGQHALAGDSVVDFGAKPFAANRALLQEQADGPARGAAAKELLLVEFADLQCPHCRDAQIVMDNLAQDFPQARVVFENFPLQEIHPFAMRAAAEGVCVRRSKGDAAFFTYAQAVYDTQAGLTTDGGEATLAAAVTKAGGDPAAAAACAATPAVQQTVAEQMKLGKRVGVDQTPSLAINGHVLPLTSLSYEVLKRIVAFQAGQDGMAVQMQPTLTTLK